MRIYISADIEGIAGVASMDQLMPSDFEYQRAREWMTDEVAVVCETLFENGVDEIVVSDSHGNGQNILIEKLPNNVKLVRSWPRPLGMAQGIEDGTFAGAMFIGYHTGATSEEGLLAHTLSGGMFFEVRLNGQAISETELHAAIAGDFNVPVIMVSGDSSYTELATELLGDVEVATTKTSTGFSSTMTLTPADAHEILRNATKRAMARINDFKPYVLKAPIDVELTYKKRTNAEVMSYLPCVERLTAHDIKFVAKDIIDASKFLNFSFSYNPRG